MIFSNVTGTSCSYRPESLRTDVYGAGMMPLNSPGGMQHPGIGVRNEICCTTAAGGGLYTVAMSINLSVRLSVCSFACLSPWQHSGRHQRRHRCTKHNLSKIPGSSRALTLGGAHIAQSDDVRVLGVQLSSDLSLDKHVNVVNAKCFFQLRQLRRIRRSLDDDCRYTLV